MSGGDNGVLKLSHQTLDANGNVLETDTFEDNHDDVIGSTPGINLTNNNDYVRRTVFNWYDAANRTTTTADYGSGDTSSGAGHWTYATIPTRPSSAPTSSANTSLVTQYGYWPDSARLQTVTDSPGHRDQILLRQRRPKDVRRAELAELRPTEHRHRLLDTLPRQELWEHDPFFATLQ